MGENSHRRKVDVHCMRNFVVSCRWSRRGNAILGCTPSADSTFGDFPPFFHFVPPRLGSGLELDPKRGSAVARRVTTVAVDDIAQTGEIGASERGTPP